MRPDKCTRQGFRSSGFRGLGYNKLASVESFDPESGVWSEEPPMLTAR